MVTVYLTSAGRNISLESYESYKHLMASVT